MSAARPRRAAAATLLALLAACGGGECDSECAAKHDAERALMTAQPVHPGTESAQ